MSVGVGLGVFGIAMMIGAARCYPATLPVPNQAVTFTTLTPENLQSFVKTWQPADKPLCKILKSNTDWDKWMGAAAVMGPHKPYAPPASLWSDKFMVLIARVVDAADPATVFDMKRVRGDRQTLAIAYHIRAPSPASYKIAAWIGVIIGADQLRDRVDIVEDGTTVCAFDKTGQAAPLHRQSAPI
jgi:hypothetical protein